MRQPLQKRYAGDPRGRQQRQQDLVTIALLAGLLVGAGITARAAERGGYLTIAADCAGCHTDKGDDPRPYAGGRGLPSPFGTIYTPNITPAPETGIGGWSDLGLTLG
jgi:hypothetical protein